jgi:hypothetical protein
MECQPVQLVDGVRRLMNLAKTKLMFHQSDVDSLMLFQGVTLVHSAHHNMLQGIIRHLRFILVYIYVRHLIIIFNNDL